MNDSMSPWATITRNKPSLRCYWFHKRWWWSNDYSRNSRIPVATYPVCGGKDGSYRVRCLKCNGCWEVKQEDR